MIYIYDRNEKQIAHLDVVPTITEEIGKLRTLEFESEEEFEKGYRVVAKTNDGFFEFIIVDSDYSRDDVKVFSYFCQDSLIETQSIPILDKRPWGNAEVVSKAIFGDTRWAVEVRNGYNLSTVFKNSYYHITVLEAFSEMVEKYRAEWITEFKVVGSEITERRVVLYQRDGKSKGRLEFGKNITKFERKILSEPIITALYVHGKGEDLGNGTYGRRISISSVNNGKDYIENTEATQKYGIGKKGQKQALYGFIIFEEETDPSNLLKLGKQELEILSQVRAEYTVNAINLDIDARIGYEVAVIDEEIGYRGYSRIIKIIRQGDDIELTFGTVTKKFVDSVQKTLKKNEQNINNAFVEINSVRTSADGKTGVFTGPSKPQKANNGDWWYRYNPDGTVDLLIFKDGEWVDELTDRLFKDVNLKIEQAQQSANEASTKIDEEAKKIQQEVEDTISEFNNYKTSNNQTIDLIKNDVSQFDNKLKAKADSTAVVDVRKTVEGIQGSIKETNAKVDGLELGDRNLLLDSKKLIKNSNYPTARYTLADSTLKHDEVVTFIIKGKMGEGKTQLCIYNSGGVVEVFDLRIKPEDFNDDGIAIKTGKWRIQHPDITPSNSFIFIYIKNNTVKTDSTIEWVKLVRGNKTSKDWTPAPEDMASQENLNEFKRTAKGNFNKITEIEKDLSTGDTFKKIQTIEQTANGNKSTLSEVKKTADGAVQLVAFNQKMSTVEGELQTLKKQTDSTTPGTLAYKINETKKTADKNHFTLSEVATDLEGKVDFIKFNSLKQTIDETSSIISDPTRKDLLSAINQKAGQVLIQVGDSDGKSRLMVTKDSTFIDKAVIQNAHIADSAIDTAKIKDASITSAKIISLDVDKINGNISNFVQSNWNAINSSVRIDGNGLYIDGSWGGAINFTRRGLTFYDKIKGQVMGYQYGLYRDDSDPRQAELMQGVFLGAELGYNLKLGIRTDIYNQNTAFLEINGVDKHSTKGTIFGELDLKNNLILNENSIIIKGNSGVRFGVGQILGNTVTYMVNVQGTAGIGFTMGGGIVVRRYDSGAGAIVWKWL